MPRSWLLAALSVAAVAGVVAVPEPAPVRAAEDKNKKEIEAAIDKGLEYLKKTPIDDFYSKGYVRADGRFVHDMYLMQVKSPAESKQPWDYNKVVKQLEGEKVFTTKAETKCSLWK